MSAKEPPDGNLMTSKFGERSCFCLVRLLARTSCGVFERCGLAVDIGSNEYRRHKNVYRTGWRGCVFVVVRIAQRMMLSVRNDTEESEKKKVEKNQSGLKTSKG